MKVTQEGFIEGSAAATPPSGIVTVYAKSDRNLYQKDSLGVETQLGGGGGAGSVTSVTSANADLSVINTTTNPVITAVASPTTRALKSATTDVNVSSATAPTADAVLTATSSTTAIWRAPVIFKANRTTTQTVTAGVATVVVFNNELFDTASCYNPVNGRFTPNVAGYYLFTCELFTSNPLNSIQTLLSKNGTTEDMGLIQYPGTTTGLLALNSSLLQFANGSTDYFEVVGYYTNGSGGSSTGFQGSFSGFLVR